MNKKQQAQTVEEKNVDNREIQPTVDSDSSFSKKNIFISYSHNDKNWKDRLVVQLSVLQKQGRLDIWNDQLIKPGDAWVKVIESAIDSALIAILLISADFLNSNFIHDVEIPLLLKNRDEKKLQIIPLFVRPCAWDQVDWLKSIQGYPSTGKALSSLSDNEVDQELADLTRVISNTLSQTAKKVPQNSNFPTLPSDIVIMVAKLPASRREFFGRERELSIFDQAWADPNTNILSLVAWGGVGKTALVTEWLNLIMNDNFRGAERVYGWSFYLQGTGGNLQVSGDEFLAHALSWFGDLDPSLGTSWEKGIRLAGLIRQKKTLLILDGLEPLQYPPGEILGKLKDQGVQALLKELAISNPGLCVVTTRSPVMDIEDHVGKSVIHIDLENLSLKTGVQLLKNLGVKGTHSQLCDTVKEYGGHALALNLLGTYIATVHNGDVRKRDLIPIISRVEEQGGHARRVMESYERWLKGKPELSILYIMGLFDRPAPGDAIDTLLEKPVIKGLTAQLQQISPDARKFAIKYLQDLRLLSKHDDTQSNTLDCHPLIRQYFGEKLLNENPKAWKKAHTYLYEYYKNIPEKECPDTLEEMAPLLAAVAHGCQAGLYNESLEEIFFPRINRKGEKKTFITDTLGAINSELALLSHFFQNPWKETVKGINRDKKAYILSRTGLLLGLLGRHKEAEKPMKNGLDCYESIENWEEAASAARHVSRYYLTQGDLVNAETFARKGVDYAKKIENSYSLMETHSTLGEVLHYTGRLKESEWAFEIAEQNKNQSNPEFPHLGRLHGFRHFELLLSLGEYEKVIEYATQTIKSKEQLEFVLGRSLHRVTLGRAYLYRALEKDSSNFSQAEKSLETALTELREAQQTRHIPSGLLALATLHRLKKEFPKAWGYLQETIEIADSAFLEIHKTDYLIEAGSLHLLQKEYVKAEEHLKEAMNRINKMGYKRREPDCLLQFARLDLERGNIEKARKSLDEINEIVENMSYYCIRAEIKAFERQLHCKSTQEVHERRMDITNPDELLSELKSLQDKISDETSEPELKEINQIAEKLLEITRGKYDAICKEYSGKRGEELDEREKIILERLLVITRERNKLPQTKNSNAEIKLLDVGTGYGRDIKYASNELGLKVIGIDNSDGFIEILTEEERKSEIPPGSYKKADMRDLSCFSDRSFDIVRYQASLLHLPVIGKGYMADKALSECHRVLKDNGIVYISVKEGNGLEFYDTQEGFGRILHQFYTMESIEMLLKRNNFNTIELPEKPSSRGKHIKWICIIAEKASSDFISLKNE